MPLGRGGALKSKQILLALSVAIAVGLVVAAVMTFLDWRVNPGGLFQSERGTDWTIVRDTAWSWFAPTALLASLVALSVAFWLARRK